MTLDAAPVSSEEGIVLIPRVGDTINTDKDYF